MLRFVLAVICVLLSLRAGLVFAADSSANPAAEKMKIEFLLRAVSESKLTFIRNGVSYDGPKAADHLRMKWDAARDKITSAAQFIDLCATKSSVSGETYEILLSDGKTRVPTAAWLSTVLYAHELTLGQPESGPADTRAAAAATVPAVAKGASPCAVDVLKYIEASGAVFFRPGGHRTNLTGHQFSAHLQGKSVLEGFSLTRSAGDFIANIASDSSLHGTVYSVKFPDGSEMEVQAWLTMAFSIGATTRPSADQP